jgi:hypothetical protein
MLTDDGDLGGTRPAAAQHALGSAPDQPRTTGRVADLPARVAPQRVAERADRAAVGERDEPRRQKAEIGESRHLSILLSTKVEQLASSRIDRATGCI